MAPFHHIHLLKNQYRNLGSRFQAMKHSHFDWLDRSTWKTSLLAQRHSTMYPLPPKYALHSQKNLERSIFLHTISNQQSIRQNKIDSLFLSLPDGSIQHRTRHVFIDHLKRRNTTVPLCFLSIIWKIEQFKSSILRIRFLGQKDNSNHNNKR